MLKKLVTVAFIILIPVWIILFYFPHILVPLGINQQINKAIGGVDLLSDTATIRVYTIGTSTPLPGIRAQTGTGIIVNGHFFLFDVGAGVVQKAENMQLPLNKLNAVFITHYHSDHFIDLPYLISRSWILGRNTNLDVYGPQGIDTIIKGINIMLSIENGYRVVHHGEHIMDISKAVGIAKEFENIRGGKQVVYKQDGITITAFDVDHSPIEPAVGYVIEYQGKKVVISGDTKKNDLVLEMANNADLLLHEVILSSVLKIAAKKLIERGDERNAAILTDIQNYHTQPHEVAAIANQANVKQLVLHHFAPAPDNIVIKNLYKQELTKYYGPIHFANDGDLFIVK
jgi:ribonuclease Z